jgi:hypothetical protein
VDRLGQGSIVWGTVEYINRAMMSIQEAAALHTHYISKFNTNKHATLTV